ncbi:hypothetical protein AR457_04445 [Streptomyces agglomeratus]|uniref:Peptidase S1 domain-containing protein n=1 Tax=Streptomyces agglomeratus TaxID=285458 RepID=A0A1E5P2S4_9ACTN|nr:hypothetical protein [Streptomyces agglomeratus]OEJ23858.1 hypothetical protein AS594_04545 [Streptomyces agglomeratus]OEJ43456.1 hypothetical protein AR457_04445 [Streptomyces agglomeratus]OEJ54625.1 hypothetical protein BGK72_31325 [Streptomyces agglomeratus]
MLRRLCTFVAALVVTVTTGAGTAQAEGRADTPTKRVYNAMQFAHPSAPDAFCTIGAVGTDDYGRKIAISAGHCAGGTEYADREIHENVAPVYDRHDFAFGPIGYMRYFKSPEGSMTGHATKDYMVIELVPEVTLSSQGPHLKQTGMVEVPSGAASPNALKPALSNERLLGAGLFDNNELVVSGQSGVWYGRITNNSSGIYQSHAPHQAGDSGGPAVWHVPGSAYPSEANGFRAQGPWAGITKARILGIPPYVYTSSANILADLRARDAADPADIYGGGFEVTANP